MTPDLQSQNPIVDAESTTEVSQPTTDEYAGRWLGAAAAGVVASAVMGAMMAVAMPGALETMIPALYGLEGGLAGVTVHLAHGAIFGVVFAAIVVLGGLSRYADRTTGAVSLGVLYGLAVWIVAASVVMPLWLGALGMDAPAIPALDPTSGLAHLVFGIVLGVLYPYLKRY